MVRAADADVAQRSSSKREPSFPTSATTLAASGIIQLLVSASFLYAARTVGVEMRRASEPWAARGFVTWWLAVGAYLLVEGLLTLASATAPPPLPVLVAIRYLGLLFISAAIWGITYYVVYLWSGRKGAAIPLAIFFALLYLAFIGYQVAHQPSAVTLDNWLVGYQYETPIEGDPIYSAILALYALPPILACLAYLSLWGKAERRDQRYRILLVSASIILYLGSGLAVRLGTNDFLKFFNLAIIGGLTALAILLAYHPPRAIRVWLGLEAQGGYRARREEDRRAQQEAFAARCRELV